jgi:structural maintenance of chromosome 4
VYFMDEIDAALDEKNTAIIANYVREKATTAQFIIISLRLYNYKLHVPLDILQL